MRKTFLVLVLVSVAFSSYALQPARQNAPAAVKCSGMNVATGKTKDLFYVYNNGLSLQMIGGRHDNMFVHLKNASVNEKLYKNAKYEVSVGVGRQKGAAQIRTRLGQETYVKVMCFQFGE